MTASACQGSELGLASAHLGTGSPGCFSLEIIPALQGRASLNSNHRSSSPCVYGDVEKCAHVRGGIL